MNIKNLTSKTAQVICGFLFLVFAIILICVDRNLISTLIAIDLDKKIFSGNIAVFLIIIAAGFLWYGFKKEDDLLAEAKKALSEATQTIAGRIGNLTINFGPPDIQNDLKNGFNSNKLKGESSIRNKGNTYKKESIQFYEDQNTKTIMAEIKDVPLIPDHFVNFEINHETNNWHGSVSPKITHVNLTKK